MDAGINEIIFIISNKKRLIKKYFYNDKFYKKIIKRKKIQELKKNIKKFYRIKKKIKFVYQNKPSGTGDAVLKAKKFITGSHFLLLFPDDLILKKNCSKNMIRISKKLNCSVMASLKVQKNNVSRWGIYSIKKNK